MSALLTIASWDMAAGLRTMPSGNMAASDFVPQPGRPDLTICQLCIMTGEAPAEERASQDAKEGPSAPARGRRAQRKGRRGQPGACRAILGQHAQAKATFGHFERMKPSSTDNKVNKSPGNKGCPVSRYSASPSRCAQKLNSSCPAGSSHRVPRPYARTASRLWHHLRRGQRRNRQRPAPRRGKRLALHE